MSESAQPMDQEVEQPTAPAERTTGVSRRTVLKRCGVAAGGLVVCGATGVGVRGAVNGAWNIGKGAPYELWRTWQDAPGLRAVVAAGALAANPHNLQPWLFALAGDTIDVYADQTRIMPVNDSDGRERVAGFGCAIENMLVAARERGLDASVRPWPSAQPGHVARLELHTGTAPSEREHALAAAISSRHSNRGPYSRRSVGEDARAALTAGVPAGAEVVWITEPARVARLGELYAQATQAIVADEAMSVEGFSWFRNDRSDVDRHRDGLTLDCQGLDSFTLFMAKVLPAQSRAKGDEFWVNTTRDVHTKTAAAYGIVRVADVRDATSRLAGGRLLQHVHLAATVSGLAMQHMNQITERIARDAATGQPDRFSSPWSEVIGFPAGQGLLSFRIGHPEHAANPSPRRRLEDITTTH